MKAFFNYRNLVFLCHKLVWQWDFAQDASYGPCLQNILNFTNMNIQTICAVFCYLNCSLCFLNISAPPHLSPSLPPGKVDGHWSHSNISLSVQQLTNYTVPLLRGWGGGGGRYLSISIFTCGEKMFLIGELQI